MSKLRGSKYNGTELSGFFPYVKWNNTNREFVILVPDMYELTRNEKLIPTLIYVNEEDLWRMINADRGNNGNNDYFTFVDEQGNLDDDTYLGISFVQYFYYLSINTLRQAKRIWKKLRYPERIYLKRRLPRGGRPVGSKIEVSADELERIASIYNNRNKIMENCYKHDWADEYVELLRDIANYEKKDFMGRKKALKIFAEQRRKWLEENF